jgi:hypothetical protein
MSDRFVQQALVGLTGDNGWTALATFKDGVTLAEVKIGHPRWAMAGSALRFENGAGRLFSRVRLSEEDQKASDAHCRPDPE